MLQLHKIICLTVRELTCVPWPKDGTHNIFSFYHAFTRLPIIPLENSGLSSGPSQPTFKTSYSLGIEHFKSPKCKVLDQPDVKDTLHKLHANYVLVPADKAANNVIIVCKKYYIDTLVKELGINNVNINNPTYIPIDDSFETIMKSHNQFITSVGLEISEEDQNLPYLYWTPKLHKSPYKHRYIAGSSKCTTKDQSCLLTKVLSTIKDGLVRYCNTKTSRNGVNNMWILKNSTSLLSSLDQLAVRTAKSVQTFDFSTLYTSIPHDLLKSRISNLVHNAFRKKDGSVRYTHIKVTRAEGYFTHDINGGGDNMYTADNISSDHLTNLM